MRINAISQHIDGIRAANSKLAATGTADSDRGKESRFISIDQQVAGCRQCGTLNVGNNIVPHDVDSEGQADSGGLAISKPTGYRNNR